jgi:adenylate kinase family enzyme
MALEPAHLQRTVIIGNGGSGKSRLAHCIAAAIAGPAIDLDQIHWEQSGYAAGRDEEAYRGLVAEASAAPIWVIEGVYGWLARVALPRATALIWLDLSWDECRAGILNRGLRRGMTASDHTQLVAWAGEYWTRDNANSHGGHLRLYDRYGGPKARLKLRSDVDAFVARLDATRAR